MAFPFPVGFLYTKIFNHQKFSKIGEVASEAVFDPVFSEIRENESTENSETKRKLISYAKTFGEFFTTNFTDKYAQIRLAKTQESTPRAETIVKKNRELYQKMDRCDIFYTRRFQPRVFN